MNLPVNDIINGHINELTGKNQYVFEIRMSICKKCPLYKDSPLSGPICNSKLYWNKETNEIRETPAEGFQNGCGCRLNAKLRLLNAFCPTQQW